MTDDSDEVRLPPSLRLLKALVIVLLLTMIAGVLVMIWLFVTRLPTGTPAPALPEALSLPAGEVAEAVTFGKGWTAVVTQSGRILIYGTDGALRQQVEITP